ncbi:hypothetical protein ACIQYL_18495 [Lysinibacillus xylanilyticus]|uniref:hypothetical protein n=1 Tax=Lysinibacillus xylanilyticus TaxID=582475 RepID=UPI003827DFB3
MYSGNQVSYDNLSENMKQKFEGLKTSIVNDLTTGGSDKALSAESGKELKSLVDEKADGKDLESLQTEITKHLADNTSHTEWIETVGGTANALTATLDGLTSYKNGLGVSFPVKSNSTAAMSLNINGLGAIPIKKANGTPFSNGIANGIYTVRYRDGAFYLQGESEVEIGQQIITPTTTNQAILKGVHDGTGYVVGSPNLLPSNIKSGVNIFNVVGNLKTSKDITIQKITVNIYSTTSGPYSSSVQLPDSTAKPMYYTCTGVFGSYPESWSGGNRYYINTQVKSDLSTYINFYISGENGRTVTLVGNVVMRDGKYFFDFTATGSWDNVDLNSGFLTFYISFICEK